MGQVRADPLGKGGFPMGGGEQDPGRTPGSHGGGGWKALGLPLITLPLTLPRGTCRHGHTAVANEPPRAGESGGFPWTIGFRQNDPPPRPLARLPVGDRLCWLTLHPSREA